MSWSRVHIQCALLLIPLKWESVQITASLYRNKAFSLWAPHVWDAALCLTSAWWAELSHLFVRRKTCLMYPIMWKPDLPTSPSSPSRFRGTMPLLKVPRGLSPSHKRSRAPQIISFSRDIYIGYKDRSPLTSLHFPSWLSRNVALACSASCVGSVTLSHTHDLLSRGILWSRDVTVTERGTVTLYPTCLAHAA